MLRPLALFAALLLAACSPRAQPANPALWRIDGPHGERGWLFGTIHTLPRPLQWRTQKVSAALAGADRLVVEIAALDDDAATARVFARLAHSPGLPPLANRVPASERPALDRLVASAGLDPGRLADTETWAAALLLAQAAQGETHAKWGIDRALLADRRLPAVELEGAARQLRLFDTLPEPAQRRLLAATVAGAPRAPAEAAALAEAWRTGDMARIATAADADMRADPELRRVLFSQRNAAWTDAIAAMLARRERPFVAVGAAHMAGPEGLPALLAARGFTVTRVE